MSRPAKTKRGREKHVVEPATTSTDHDAKPSRGRIVSAVVALFLARYLLPAEATASGQTTVLAAAWIGLAALVSYLDWRAGHRWTVDWRDGVVLATTGPPIVAGLLSRFAQLDHRAAQNLTIEWASLAVSLLLMRRCLSTAGFRRVLAAGMVSLLAAVACYGLWQHYVWYPSTAAQLIEFERLESLASPSPAEQAEKQKLLQELGPQFVGSDKVSRRLMRDRLVNSTEPLGFFALANSLAGLVGVAGMLMLLSRRPLSRSQLLGWSACGCVLLLALFLSKSRTAYVATFVAIGAAVLLAYGKRVPWRMLGTAFVGVTALVALLVLSGSLDLEVLTESSRSLAYRVEYWTATIELLGHNWLTGVGLGNFRPAYLAFKLPGSSEEILDPHNWILEAWTTAGIVGLAATVVGCAYSAATNFRRLIALPEQSDVDVAGNVQAPLAIATLIALVWNGFPIQIDQPILFTGAAALLIAAIAKWTWTERRLQVASLSFSVLLLVHLLASGGYGMPAIWQTLLAGLLVLPVTSSGQRVVDDGKMHVVQGVLVAGLLIAVVFVVRPNLARDRWLTDAETRIYFEGDQQGAIRSLKRAHEADSLSPEPLIQLASLYASQNRMDEARAAALKAVETSPKSPTLKQWAASLLLSLNEADAAAELLDQAVAGYPNGADVRADAAVVFEKVGDERAASEAQRAIELDDLNRAAGHADKIFSDKLRSQLEQIAGAGR